MDYEQMLQWAERIKTRCFNKGKTEQQTRSEIFNSALVQFSDDFDYVDDNAIQLANRVVATVFPDVPGSYTNTLIATN